LKCDTCNLHLKLDEAEERSVVGISRLLADYIDTITLTPSIAEADDWAVEESSEAATKSENPHEL